MNINAGELHPFIIGSDGGDTFTSGIIEVLETYDVGYCYDVNCSVPTVLGNLTDVSGKFKSGIYCYIYPDSMYENLLNLRVDKMVRKLAYNCSMALSGFYVNQFGNSFNDSVLLGDKHRLSEFVDFVKKTNYQAHNGTSLANTIESLIELDYVLDIPDGIPDDITDRIRSNLQRFVRESN